MVWKLFPVTSSSEGRSIGWIIPYIGWPASVVVGELLEESPIVLRCVCDVSALRTHLPNPSIKGDVVRLFLSGRDHPYRQDFHAPTKLLPEALQSPGRAGMPASWMRLPTQKASEIEQLLPHQWMPG